MSIYLGNQLLAGGNTSNANLDLSNISNDAKVLISNMAMPSGRYINLTIGASGTSYTAPADGYFCCRIAFTGNQFTVLFNNTQLLGNSANANGSYTSYCFIPAKKGDVVYHYYNATNDLLRFVYAQGSESEAQ